MLELVRPCAALKHSYLEALAEFHAESRFVYLRTDALRHHFDAHLRAERALIHPDNIAIFRVPETIYWLADGERFLGRLELRHRLHQPVNDIGGHIGYAIRPGQRRRGYGHAILKLGLQKAAWHGLSDVLLTCDPDNIASKKIIEKNGGRFENRVVRVIDGITYHKLRYWIAVPAAPALGAVDPASVGQESQTGAPPRV